MTEPFEESPNVIKTTLKKENTENFELFFKIVIQYVEMITQTKKNEDHPKTFIREMGNRSILKCAIAKELSRVT